jgi:predicted NACHT family NTPase
MRPDTSRTALIGYADNLADAVSRRETVLLDQLRAGPDMVVDDLEFRAERRLKLSAGDAIGVLADIGPYFRRQETRRMVVLGEAGAGKTVLAVRFVLDQLRYRATADAARAGQPVPVRINASGWDGSADFTAWLSDQLAIDYGLNVRVARAMVDTDRILPVLDGLDEMDAPEAEPVLASAALARLNEPPWRNRAVVVACRSTVYKEIRDLRGDAGLQFATTVTLQPFSADDIYIYLEQYRDELGIAEAAWAPVSDQLEQAHDGVLATALRTSWMLSLAATALHWGGHQTAAELSVCRARSNTSRFCACHFS